MLRGIIKSNPEYPVHYRAEVAFPRDGREFLVVDDDTMFEAGKADAQKLFEEQRMQLPDVAIPHPLRPVIYHVAEPSEFNSKRVVQRNGRLLDLPGRPLVLDQAAYEYIKQAFGTQLSCEPIGGAPDALAMMQRMQQVEAENARLRAELGKAKK